MQSSGKVTLYLDYLSQPSRAVLSFCLINNIPVEIIETEIISGATESESFISVSPTKTVPAITHNSLSIYESSAILIYLCSIFSIPDHWYPSDPELQGKVNVYLHWHHLNVRYGCGHYFYRKAVRPQFSNRIFSRDFEEEMLFVQRKSLELLEATLKKHDFVAETTEMSIADLVCYCEVVHLRLLNFDFSVYPKLASWMNRISGIEGVRKAHQKFDTYLANFKL